mgnify:CR=1 FL=1
MGLEGWVKELCHLDRAKARVGAEPSDYHCSHSAARERPSVPKHTADYRVSSIVTGTCLPEWAGTALSTVVGTVPL